MGFEQAGKPIDWEEYRQQLRERLSKLSQDELKQRLSWREQEMESYEGHYGQGNQFSNQAQVDIRVLRELITE